jgi:hypothetical protein
LWEKNLWKESMIFFFVLVTTIGFGDICDNYYKLYMIQLWINVL